jgi:hypothetical protein
LPQEIQIARCLALFEFLLTQAIKDVFERLTARPHTAVRLEHFIVSRPRGVSIKQGIHNSIDLSHSKQLAKYGKKIKALASACLSRADHRQAQAFLPLSNKEVLSGPRFAAIRTPRIFLISCFLLFLN